MEETLGRRIMTNRKRLALTQDKLAEMLGVTAQAVSKWENDQSCPDITILPQLADIFGITTDELLGRAPVAEAKSTDDFAENGVADTPDGSGIEWTYEGGKKGALTLALLVLLVGTLTFLARLLSWDVSFWNILWPCSILMFGLGGIIHKFSFFSIGCVLLGGYFLLDNLNVIRWELPGALLFPVLILIFGVTLLIDALKKPLHPSQRFHHIGRNGKTQNHFTSDGEQFTCALSFGESHRPVTLPLLSRGDISCSFGELVVDLTQCEKFAEDCRLSATCSFGELELLVPKHIRVVQNGSTSFSSINVHGHSNPDATGSILLDSKVSFGQIVIRYI